MNVVLICAALLLAQAPPDGDDAAPAAPGQAAAAPATNDDGKTPAAGQASTADGPAAAEQAAGPEEHAGDEAATRVREMLGEMMSTGAVGLLLKGGIFMWPILFMGILAAGVIIERYRSLKMLSTDSSALREQVHRLLLADQVEDALELCDREQGPVPAILSAGLRKYFVLRRLNYDASKIREQVIKSMDDYSIHVVAALERHLPVLATISSVAPMLGFLGTVAGMITSFNDIVAKMGEMNIVEAAAGGISVALLTTAFGLLIGIPAFMAFNYFTSVINRFVLDVEESATELIEAVTLQMALGGTADAAAPAPLESEYSAGG